MELMFQNSFIYLFIIYLFAIYQKLILLTYSSESYMKMNIKYIYINILTRKSLFERAYIRHYQSELKNSY